MMIGLSANICTNARADAPLNYFLHANGPAARPTLYLG